MVLSARIQTSSKYFSIFILITIAFFLLPTNSLAYEYLEDGNYIRCTGTCQYDSDPGECANGATIGDGHCGSACDDGKTWTKYKSDCKLISESSSGEETCAWIRVKDADVCSIGDKCISGDKGLRPGFCDCSTGGSIYKTCCSGSTAIACNISSYNNDGKGDDEGTCSPNVQVAGTGIDADCSDVQDPDSTYNCVSDACVEDSSGNGSSLSACNDACGDGVANCNATYGGWCSNYSNCQSPNTQHPGTECDSNGGTQICCTQQTNDCAVGTCEESPCPPPANYIHYPDGDSQCIPMDKICCIPDGDCNPYDCPSDRGCSTGSWRRYEWKIIAGCKDCIVQDKAPSGDTVWIQLDTCGFDIDANSANFPSIDVSYDDDWWEGVESITVDWGDRHIKTYDTYGYGDNMTLYKEEKYASDGEYTIRVSGRGVYKGCESSVKKRRSCGEVNTKVTVINTPPKCTSITPQNATIQATTGVDEYQQFVASFAGAHAPYLVNFFTSAGDFDPDWFADVSDTSRASRYSNPNPQNGVEVYFNVTDSNGISAWTNSNNIPSECITTVNIAAIPEAVAPDAPNLSCSYDQASKNLTISWDHWNLINDYPTYSDPTVPPVEVWVGFCEQNGVATGPNHISCDPNAMAPYWYQAIEVPGIEIYSKTHSRDTSYSVAPVQTYFDNEKVVKLDVSTRDARGTTDGHNSLEFKYYQDSIPPLDAQFTKAEYNSKTNEVDFEWAWVGDNTCSMGGCTIAGCGTSANPCAEGVQYPHAPRLSCFSCI